MIRVKTKHNRPRFFRGGIEFGRGWLYLSESSDNLPEGTEPDISAEQSAAIRTEKRFLEVEEVSQPDARKLSEPSPGTGESAGKSGKAAGPVNINTATAKELSAVKGLGDETAAAIVARRERSGAYEKLEDLVEISGLGKATVKKLADSLTV
jgi:competence ComEA-like helix-hairpin-helix protein